VKTSEDELAFYRACREIGEEMARERASRELTPSQIEALMKLTITE
jgi:hypothetical protein